MAHPQIKAWLVASLALVTACSSPNQSDAGMGGASATGGMSVSNAGGGGTAATAGGSSGGISTAAGTAGVASGGANSAGTAGAPGVAGAAGNNGGSGGAGGAAGGSGGSGGRATGGTSGAGGAAGQGGGGAGGAGGYNPCPTAAGMPCIVLPLGDSITEGYMSSGANGGYRVEIFRRAVQDAKNVTFVGSLQNGPSMVSNKPFPQHHEGHGGYTIEGSGGIAGKITDQAISNNKPHIVLLKIGTNDINGNNDVANAPTRLGKLIDEIITDAPNALVVVSTIIPMNNGNNSKGVTYNGAIGNLVSTRAQAGKHVVMVDSYAAFAKDANYATSLMSDTLHPNVTGYALIGTTFYAAIGAFLPPS